MKKLKFGIPKGSLEKATISLFEKSGWKINVNDRSYFPDINDENIEVTLCRAQEMSRYVENGTIPLNKTLREIGLTDVGGLLPQELEATVENLITARSGIYHPASNAGDSTASAPPRGSQKPGTYDLYNNWDLNAAGAVFEKLTGKDIYDVLETDMAKPIQH